MKISVLVTQPLEWKGQSYVPGQAIQLTPLDAIVLAKKRQVTLSKRRAKPVPPPEPALEPAPEPPRKRYRRKDVQPDETAVLRAETLVLHGDDPPADPQD